ncbi:hypothetical protein [Desulfosarcina sp.]|uniref:hypothetical protein n=1 Tax=Desulfosarcina sp. TaxID=2027861 RepID=UPI00356641D6
MAKPAKKDPAPQAPDHPTEAATPPDGENIDKIRDILFGSQSRQIEKKLSAVEEKIDKEIDFLRSETKTTLEALEQFVRKELQSLSDQLNRERSERTEFVDSLSGRLADTQKALDKKLGQLNDKVVKDQRDTQEQILLQTKSLLDEMHEKNDGLQKRMDQSIKALAKEKTDRLALANLMMEAAVRLKDDLQLPEPE